MQALYILLLGRCSPLGPVLSRPTQVQSGSPPFAEPPEQQHQVLGGLWIEGSGFGVVLGRVPTWRET